jgi:RNA polymerase sigma-70 factor, ECF subfamily
VPDGSRSFDPAEAPDLGRIAALYREHHAFVWRVLRRCGVPEPDLDDAVQDTFLVVVRRLDDFDGRAAITTWLYAVAVRVASTTRRSRTREHARRRAAGAGVHAASVIDPEAELSRVEAARVLDDLLDELDDTKRTVFVLAELEGVRVPEISQILGVNVRTIHSRLRLARERFGAALQRRHARDEGRALRTRWAVQRLAAAADERPTPTRRKAVAAALVANIQTGALPSLPGWQAITLVAPTPFVLPLVATLALGGAALGITAVAVGQGGREPPALADRSRDDASSGRAGANANASPGVPPSMPASEADGASAHPSGEIARPVASAEPRDPAAALDAMPAVPAPGPSRPAASDAAADSASASTLAEETALLETARTALTRGDTEAALRALDRHADRYPGGELESEARSTRLRALCRAGRSQQARAMADALAPAGGSRWHAIVDAACGP